MRSRLPIVRLVVGFVAAAILAPARLVAQAAPQESRWKLPSKAIVDLVDAPLAPAVSVDPSKRRLLLAELSPMPPLADLARPMLHLAGERVDPGNNGPHGPREIVGFSLLDLGSGATTKVALPPDSALGFPSFSPDGDRLAFTRTLTDGIEIWVADAATGRAHAVTPARVNGLGPMLQWMPDGHRLLVSMVPDSRPPMPTRPLVPPGPVVQQTTRVKGSVKTYQDLLQDPTDERLFEYFFTSEIVLVDPEGGTWVKLLPPAIWREVDPSPDGGFLLTTRLVPPWSYLFPASEFPEITEVHDARGKLVREIHRRGLLDSVPNEGVPTGPRSLQWRPDAPATLLYAETQDGGDTMKPVHPRDAVFALDLTASAPSPVESLRTEHRFLGIQWFEEGGRALVREYDREPRFARTWLCEFGGSGSTCGARRLIWERSVRDRYGDPGQPITKLNRAGRSVIASKDDRILLAGQGATPKGDHPFLARMALGDFKIDRLWTCGDGELESVASALAPDGSSFLTRHQSPTSPPNWFRRELGNERRVAMTSFVDPQPQIRGATKELLTYQRDDGVRLSGTLYLPPGYAAGTRLPLFVWAYPLEYNDPATAGQVSGSPFQFTTIRGASHLALLLAGYAVLDNATMPIVGAPDVANDTFVAQIVASAKAAIDAVAARGVADPARVAVGGHSYGAFMTANLLAHCDLFRAGIARSGAYNRTLTPFGFQSERRTFWEAPEVYMNLSPFTHATKIHAPLLLIHGQLDNNMGTFPIQSERLFQAIQGAGGTARLLELPFEAHGYSARESNLDVLAEMVEWLDRYVKSPPAPAGASGG